MSPSVRESVSQSGICLFHFEETKLLFVRKCEITTSEGNKLACSFVTLDRNGEKIGVENLETPANGVLPHAILRSQDIDQIILFPQ